MVKRGSEILLPTSGSRIQLDHHSNEDEAIDLMLDQINNNMWHGISNDCI